MAMVVRLLEVTVATSSDPPFVSYSASEWVGELKPITWNLKRQQDNTGSWTFNTPYTVEYADVLADPTQRVMAYFYLDGVDQMHGLVDDVQLNVSGDKLVYTVSGIGEAGELDRFLSKNFSHYFDMELVAILYDLLDWAGWALGDFDTMLETDVKTTIDVRDMKTILPQIRKVCESSPGMHWRYGGLNAEGKQTLDFGFFDEVQDIRLRQDTSRVLTPSLASAEASIQTISVQESRVNLISEVHGNGGTYNLSADPDRQYVMTLWHVNELITAFPAIEDPDYPIIVDGNGFFRIRNDTLYPAGGSSRETWDFMVTENTEPATLPEVVAGALGLYKKCIRFLQEHANVDQSFAANVVGLKTMPAVSDRIYVDANYLTTGIPGCGDIQIPGLEIHEDLRVASWGLKGAGDKIAASFSLAKIEYVGAGPDPLAGFSTDMDPRDDFFDAGADDVVQFAETWAEPPYNRRWGSLTGDFGVQAQDDNTTVQAAGAASDCSLSVSGILGKSITITLPATPPGATKVFLIGFAPTPADNFLLEVTQDPLIGVQPLIVCFTWGRDWTVADAVTLKAYFRFA